MMKRQIIYLLIGIAIIVAGVAVYWFVFRADTAGDENTNTIVTPRNPIGNYDLDEQQKKTLGLSQNVNATLEVVDAGQGDGSTIQILNIDPSSYETGDTDGDGLLDQDEISFYKTDPNNFDTDDDGVDDRTEWATGLDPNNPDTLDNGKGDYYNLLNDPDLVKDSDRDGLRDVEEETYGSDPNKSDTDGDGFPDGSEVKGGFSPTGEGRL